MLSTYPIATAGQPAVCAASFWIDLVDPTPGESEQVARECGVQVPSRESLQEIETSSRTRVDGDVLYMSMPLAIQDGTRGLAPVPLGFILSPQRLVTVRYSEVHAFARVLERVRTDKKMNSASTFVALIDGMVDFDADMLEKLSSDLAAVSAQAFGHNGVAPVRDKQHSRALRDCVNAVGTVGERLSRIRETLLGLQRIIGFVSESAREGQLLLPELRTHLKRRARTSPHWSNSNRTCPARRSFCSTPYSASSTPSRTRSSRC